ncbi:hypothetical protein [Bradyrhizobium mercantei]|uniref:hypothetical protein n=1 Tax=Bradyrhizobium mercantei TaxID=1904807 RepID=UPI0011777400|nr:hypothetical protein [Bradyrhizobium mercantei]
MPLYDNASDQAVLLLPSGQTLKVQGIELYPADELGHIAATRAEAARNLGTVSTGIGFIGSPAWAIGASAALGFIESAVAEANKKAGLRLLAKAEEMWTATSRRGLLFRVLDIDRIDRPAPSAWVGNVPASEPVFVGAMGRKEKRQFLELHGKTEADVVNDHVERRTSRSYVHHGDDFIMVDTEFGLMNVRWSSVVGYVAPSRAASQPPPIPTI